ncbi:MAG: hypothetical protein JWN77_3146 [Frankiales bacterium]|jgi:uncharacterized protein (DUF433 family)|nr:hypothetical protein [Frankiales bacterium]
MTALLDASGVPDRFTAPLYTLAEASQFLGVPSSTLHSWARGYRKQRVTAADVVGEPILTTVQKPTGVRGPLVPFVGLAEGLVLAGMRRSGVPLQRIRPALSELDRQFGLNHALASKRLYTDGAEVLYDFADSADDETASALRNLVVVRSGQRVFVEVMQQYLKRIEFDSAGWAQLLHLPGYEVADVVVDPSRGFGQPIFERGGARVQDALEMFRAGESLTVVAEEYRVPLVQLEDAVRVAMPHAA